LGTNENHYSPSSRWLYSNNSHKNTVSLTPLRGKERKVLSVSSLFAWLGLPGVGSEVLRPPFPGWSRGRTLVNVTLGKQYKGLDWRG